MEIDVVPDNCKKTENTSSEFVVVNIPSSDDREDMYFTTENSSESSVEKNKGLDSRLHINSHNKKVMKHALRQQAKRRRKNTTIAAGNSAPLPRIIVKPLPPQPTEEVSTPVKTPTMREVLASIPGFSIKPRKRSNKKLSTAAQLEQTKEGCIDLETPDSILVNTNLRALLNKHTFAILPPLYQYKLVQLLPNVDRQGASLQPDVPTRLSTSGLNNEFFARACLEWRERLAEGEFTPENQQKLKSEAEKEKSKLDPWKLKHFEPIWGEKNQVQSDTNTIILPNRARPSLKTTIKLRPTTSISSKQSKSAPTFTNRIRTVGAITRAITSIREEIDLNSTPVETSNKSAIPDLIPIKNTKNSHTPIQRPEIVISQTQSNDSNESAFCNDDVDPLQITESSMDSNETRHSEIGAVCIDEQTVVSEAVVETSETFKGKIDVRVPEKRPRSPSPECDEIKAKKLSLSPVSSPPEQLPCEETKEEVKEIASVEEQVVPTSIVETLPEELAQETDTKEEEEDEEEEEEVSNVCNTETCDSSKESSTKDFPNEVDTNAENTQSVDSSIQENPKSVEDVQEYTALDNEETEKELSSVEEVPTDTNTSTELEIPESFSILPNSIILQQESIEMEKNCDEESCTEETAEKLEAAVEESDLVLSQLDEQVGFDAADNTVTESEEDANEARFIDAENYVLESGAISDINSPSKLQLPDQLVDESKAVGDDDENEEEREEIHAALFATGVSRTDECWDVDSSTEKLLAEVPLHTIDSVPVAMTVINTEEAAGDVAVIPMEEELEVRLEEGSFPVPDDWPYGVKMDSDMVAAALGTPDNISVAESSTPMSHFPEYSANQVKLELEVTLTPEIVNTDSLVTSSVGGASSQANPTSVPSSSKSTVTTVIPPTTIVCLPSVVSSSALLQPHAAAAPPATSAPTFINSSNSMPRTAMVASSSALPYLAITTSGPMRAVTTHTKSKAKGTAKDSQVTSGSSSNRNRNNSNKPPPGAVNLERSYQICQAVIQNSPNRDQLRCQLKPPPSLLAANGALASKKQDGSGGGRATQYGTVTSSRGGNKPFTPPLPAAANFTVIPTGNGVKALQNGPTKVASGGPRSQYQQQRQPSPGPVFVRHVFTSGQGIPVTMAVLPPPAQAALSPEVVESPTGQLGHVGQYILVQRTGGDLQAVPRSSSAPPSNHQQVGTGGSAHFVSVGARGRPASVEVDHPQQHEAGPQLVVCPNPGTQAVTRRDRAVPTGFVYSEVGELPQHNYTIIGDNIAMVEQPLASAGAYPVVGPSHLIVQPKGTTARVPIARTDASCVCNLKAMIMCKKCGAFCHDDCIGPSRLCVTCLIR